MSIQLSTTLRNAILDQIETTVGVSAKIMIYSGTEPATCATALSGNTLLAEFDMASDWAANASSASKALNSTPLSATAAGTGTATFFRLFASDGTTCHMQGTVGTSGTDAIIDNTSIVSGQTVTISTWAFTEAGA